MIYLDNYVGNWVNTNLYRISQVGTADGMVFARPNVLYSGMIYRYTEEPTPVTPVTNPVTYMTPDTDPSAQATYAPGGGSPTDVLNTPLTGFTIVDGAVSPSTTILNAFDNIVAKLQNKSVFSNVMIGFVPAYGPINGSSTLFEALAALTFKTHTQAIINPTFISLADAALPLTPSISSNNITYGPATINLPQNLAPTSYLAFVNVTTSSTGGCTLTLVSSNGAVLSGVTSQTVGPSLTNYQLIFSGILRTDATSNPEMYIIAEDLTTSVQINANSSILII